VQPTTHRQGAKQQTNGTDLDRTPAVEVIKDGAAKPQLWLPKAVKKGALPVPEQDNNQPAVEYERAAFSNSNSTTFTASTIEGRQYTEIKIPKVQPGCGSYAPGHHFHWIPIFNHSHPRVPAKVRWVEGKMFEATLENNEKVNWYYHQPERVILALEQCDADAVKVTEGRPWVFISSGGQAFAFNMSEEPIGDCKTDAQLTRESVEKTHKKYLREATNEIRIEASYSEQVFDAEAEAKRIRGAIERIPVGGRYVAGAAMPSLNRNLRIAELQKARIHTLVSHREQPVADQFEATCSCGLVTKVFSPSQKVGSIERVLLNQFGHRDFVKNKPVAVFKAAKPYTGETVDWCFFCNDEVSPNEHSHFEIWGVNSAHHKFLNMPPTVVTTVVVGKADTQQAHVHCKFCGQVTEEIYVNSILITAVAQLHNEWHSLPQLVGLVRRQSCKSVERYIPERQGHTSITKDKWAEAKSLPRLPVQVTFMGDAEFELDTNNGAPKSYWYHDPTELFKWVRDSQSHGGENQVTFIESGPYLVCGKSFDAPHVLGLSTTEIEPCTVSKLEAGRFNEVFAPYEGDTSGDLLERD